MKNVVRTFLFVLAICMMIIPAEQFIHGLMPREASAKGQHHAEKHIVNGEEFLSHGEDTMEENPQFKTVSLTPRAPRDSRTATFCGGTGQDGQRVQIVYANVEGQPDRYQEVLPTIQAVSEQGSELIDTNAQMMGGRRVIRFVTGGNCQIEVMKTTIARASAEDFWKLVDETIAQGFKKPQRKYLFFVDDTKYCGYSTTKNDDSVRGSEHSGNSYGIVGSKCWNPNIMVHELMHGLGAVQLSAPHATRGWHCIDEHDLMCYADADGVVMQIACPDRAFEDVLDCGHDDYFSIDPPKGSYLATHWNTANSPFLFDPSQANSTRKDKKKKEENGKKKDQRHSRKSHR